MEFRFVNDDPLGSGNRKTVRSHVMKGKNSGKTHVSRGHKRNKEAAARNVHVLPPRDMIATLRQMAPRCRPIPDYYSTNASSFKMPGRDLIDFYAVGEALYPPEFCQSQNPMKTVWFEYLLTDKAFFHVSLSMTATCLDFFEYKEHESPEAIAHMTQAFALVNQRLSGPDAISNPTIALVCMLICQESVRGDLEKYKTHLLGLVRMVELRGGIHVLEENDDVLQKICRLNEGSGVQAKSAVSRSDIQYALHTESPALYAYDAMPQRVMQEICHNGIQSQRPMAAIFSTAEPTLRQLIRDVDSISVLFNNCKRNSKLKAHEFSATILSLGYRLLRVQGQESRSLEAIQEACLLGFVCFYTTLLLQFGRQRHLLYEKLSRRLKTSVDGLLPICHHPHFQPTSIWLLMIGAISVFERKEDIWLLPALVRVSELMHLKTWDAMRNELKEYPWIRAIHNEQGKRVWDKVQRYQLSKRIG
ncbi:hypothetical protein CT0861_10081 [Colletotrichum tofieldiae]|uniref:C6 transcription factor n=1 Tax=Colletotrichum tofieldiae TaxID=708197 RepID=A0A166SPS6_9PEZI|nr:hypothetical protein CT0861_10081 [Colletotrichum tofieldiae]